MVDSNNLTHSRWGDAGQTTLELAGARPHSGLWAGYLLVLLFYVGQDRSKLILIKIKYQFAFESIGRCS